MKAEIVSRGIPAERVVVVPNAVDDSFLEPLPNGAERRSRLGLRADDFVVGTVATLAPHEGLHTLLEAGAILRRRGIPIRLLIIGDGSARAALERQADDLDLADGTAIFTGRVPHDQVRQYHAVLDVFAVPRTAQRVCHLVSPLKPVEAMASGLAVAASNVKALADIIEPELNGTLIQAEDPAAWSDSLQSLFCSPSRRHTMGDAARARVRQGRTWSHIAELTRGVYRELGAA